MNNIYTLKINFVLVYILEFRRYVPCIETIEKIIDVKKAVFKRIWPQSVSFGW